MYDTMIDWSVMVSDTMIDWSVMVSDTMIGVLWCLIP